MDKFWEWIANKVKQPLTVLFFLLGTLLILLGLTTGLEVPVLKQLQPVGPYQLVALALGVALLGVAVLIDRWSKDMIPEKAIPSDLHQSFTARRASLGNNQSTILTFIEIEQEGNIVRAVSQDNIESRFKQYGHAELYYRLEQLRLLGFLEKEQIGRGQDGNYRFTYRLSPAYRKDLGVTFIPWRAYQSIEEASKRKPRH